MAKWPISVEAIDFEPNAPALGDEAIEALAALLVEMAFGDVAAQSDVATVTAK